MVRFPRYYDPAFPAFIPCLLLHIAFTVRDQVIERREGPLEGDRQ